MRQPPEGFGRLSAKERRSEPQKNIAMRQLPCDSHHRAPRTVDGMDLKAHSIHSTDQRTVCVCVIGHSTRTKGHEVYDQLHPVASVREEHFFCRLSVHEENVVDEDMTEGFARVIITVKETTSLVRVIQLRRYPPGREFDPRPATRRKEPAHEPCPFRHDQHLRPAHDILHESRT